MRKIIILPLFFIASVLAALPARAEDKNVLFVFTFHQVVGKYVGNFNVNGILSESGEAESGLMVVNGIAKADKIIRMRGGNIYMTVTGPFNVNPPYVTVNGQWTLTGGTGIYDGISGGGDAVIFGDLRSVITFSGAYQGRVKLPHGAD